MISILKGLQHHSKTSGCSNDDYLSELEKLKRLSQ